MVSQDHNVRSTPLAPHRQYQAQFTELARQQNYDTFSGVLNRQGQSYHENHLEQPELSFNQLSGTLSSQDRSFSPPSSAASARIADLEARLAASELANEEINAINRRLVAEVTNLTEAKNVLEKEKLNKECDELIAGVRAEAQNYEHFTELRQKHEQLNREHRNLAEDHAYLIQDYNCLRDSTESNTEYLKSEDEAEDARGNQFPSAPLFGQHSRGAAMNTQGRRGRGGFLMNLRKMAEDYAKRGYDDDTINAECLARLEQAGRPIPGGSRRNFHWRSLLRDYGW